MKQLSFVLLFPILLFGCNSKPGKKPVTNAAVIDPAKIECIPMQYSWGFNENFSPGTFGKTTLVYNSTKPAAKVIDTLPFNTSVNILKEYPAFFLVCTPKSKSGYINKTDLYFHLLFWGLKSNTYLFGIDRYAKPTADTDNFHECDASGLKIIKINAANQILDVYHDSIRGTHYELKQIYQSALKTTDAVFYLNYHCYDGVGTETDHFIVDNGKKLSRLIISGGSGDGGVSNDNIVYLPVKLANGNKIVLAKNGFLSVDANTAKVELYPYPVNCGIPINELVVVISRSVEDLATEDGKQKYNSDGTMAQKITINEITYYRWDGDRLRKAGQRSERQSFAVDTSG